MPSTMRLKWRAWSWAAILLLVLAVVAAAVTSVIAKPASLAIRAAESYRAVGVTTTTTSPTLASYACPQNASWQALQQKLTTRFGDEIFYAHGPNGCTFDSLTQTYVDVLEGPPGADVIMATRLTVTTSASSRSTGAAREEPLLAATASAPRMPRLRRSPTGRSTSRRDLALSLTCHMRFRVLDPCALPARCQGPSM